MGETTIIVTKTKNIPKRQKTKTKKTETKTDKDKKPEKPERSILLSSSPPSSSI